MPTCCQPLHLKQQFAQNAEQLMRSRYSAFALQQIDYILETTALGHKPLWILRLQIGVNPING